jgi:hypothetical protein
MRFPLAGLRGLQTFSPKLANGFEINGFQFYWEFNRKCGKQKRRPGGRLSILFWQIILQLTLYDLSLELLSENRLWYCSDLLVDDLTTLENQEGRNASYTKARRYRRVLIYV